MPDCPGAGSGDPNDYDYRSMEEHREDNIAKARRWIKKKGFEVIRVGTPKDGEHFVNYEIEDDCGFYGFVSDVRKILKAKYTPLHNTKEVTFSVGHVTNFNEKYRYYIVKKRGCPGTAKTGNN